MVLNHRFFFQNRSPKILFLYQLLNKLQTIKLKILSIKNNWPIRNYYKDQNHTNNVELEFNKITMRRHQTSNFDCKM